MFEEIYLLVLRSIFTIILFSIGYLVTKYLDNKPLGMQTILDYVVKDFIKIFIVRIIIAWLYFGKFLNQSYGHYLSLLLVQCQKYSNFAILTQTIIAVILRYIYVFHQNILNIYEDSKIILMMRSLLGIFCLIETLADISATENRIDYNHFMNQEYDKELLKQSGNVVMLILLILGLIITVSVQIRIEFFKNTVDSNSDACQMEAGNSENMENEGNSYCGKIFLRFSMMLLIFIFIMIIDWNLRGRMEAEDVFLSELRMSVIVQFLLCNIVVVWIRRNPKMCKFCVNVFKVGMCQVAWIFPARVEPSY